MKRWQRTALCIAGVAAVMYGMIYVDVVMRAKHAYQEGEKYWAWSEHPELKAQALDEKRGRELKEAERRLARGELKKEDYDRELELINFDRDQAMRESSIKYAYIWYQTAVELFSPPESTWVKRSRERMPLAKERWKEELRAAKIPFEEYMLE
jgi:hypothetical protein